MHFTYATIDAFNAGLLHAFGGIVGTLIVMKCIKWIFTAPSKMFK